MALLETMFCTLLYVFLILLFARAILSWFPMSEGTIASSAQTFLFTVTEPVLAPMRKVLPQPNMGGMGLDLSFLLLSIALISLQSILCR
ncbi:MAG: YggT family protein [Acidimicrobiales bacterium]